MWPAHSRLIVDAPRHQRHVFRHEYVLEQERARYRAAHSKRIPVAENRYSFRLGGERGIERVATRGLPAVRDLGAEDAVIVGMARKQSENLLAVDDPAALDRLRL